jgi:hypothetical protein
MITKESSDPKAPKKNDPPKPAARSITSRVPDTNQDCNCSADVPV